MAQGARGRGRTGTWPVEGRRETAMLLPWPWSLAGLRDPLSRWIALELAPGRLVPWLPVAFGLGVVIYFTADREPSLWAAGSLAAFVTTLAVLARGRALAMPLTLGAAAVACGFAAATLKSATVDHPVLWHSASSVDVVGFVAAREERERSDRIVVDVRKIEGRRLDQAPNRIRVSVRRGTAPPVGAFVSFKARLSSPLAPLRPGGYDFARDLWFQGIGATGFVLGTIKRVEAVEVASLAIRYAALVESVRDAIDGRIRAAVGGDAGAIASALITGKRDAISAPVNDAMYVSSLAHVLSISGYHMAVVAGVAFFVIRGVLALVPVLAFRHPIKKWAASAALLAAALYLMISGAEVATQRAFIMTAVVLGGVLIDRAALTVRTLSVAALIVLAFAPQAVVHPSFQMSFAATLALVAAYERGLPWTSAGPDTSLGARIALWGGREIATLALASMVAGAATTLYAAYHFHRLAPYGVLANLLGMPIISFVSMPAGLLALVAMPFGFDGPLWRVMGQGIDGMIAVALWVAGLPGAVGQIAAFGVGPVLFGTLGLALIGLLRSPLRWGGALVLALGIAMAVRTPQPDVYVASAGDAVAVRGRDGKITVMRSGRDAFAVREWLMADADPRSTGDPRLRAGAPCDGAGCVARLADGRVVALALTPEAFEDDCRDAALIITRRTAPGDCAAFVIDRDRLHRSGAVTLRWNGGTWSVHSARSTGEQRPWMRAVPPTAFESAAPQSAPAPAPARPAPDATPRLDDLEPGD